MVLAIIVTVFPEPRETAKAMSIYAFVASAGGSIGLLVGGVLTEALSWHWIFFINLPIGVAALLLGSRLIPRDAGMGLHHGVDVLGGLLVTLTPSLGVYAILQAGDSGWLSARTVALFAATAGLVAVLLLRESTARTPLVPLRIFRSRTLVAANLLRALFPVGLFGTFFLGALYMQDVLGYSSLQTGVAFLPQTVAVGGVSLLVTRRLVGRFGARPVLIAGLTLVAAGLALFSRAPVDGSYATSLLPVTLLVGIGAGLIFAPSATLAMSGVARTEVGLASGLASRRCRRAGKRLERTQRCAHRRRHRDGDRLDRRVSPGVHHRSRVRSVRSRGHRAGVALPGRRRLAGAPRRGTATHAGASGRRHRGPCLGRQSHPEGRSGEATALSDGRASGCPISTAASRMMSEGAASPTRPTGSIRRALEGAPGSAGRTESTSPDLLVAMTIS